MTKKRRALKPKSKKRLIWMSAVCTIFGLVWMRLFGQAIGATIFLTVLLLWFLLDDNREHLRQMDFWLALLVVLGLHGAIMVRVVLPGALNRPGILILAFLEIFVFGITVALAMRNSAGEP